MKLAWLENRIYVVHSGIPRVRVFSDRAPFEELEGIEVKELDTPFGIEACPVNRALFINDFNQGCIFKIQMPNEELTRWDIGLGREPMTISITPNMELLVAVDCYIKDPDDGDDSVEDDDDDDADEEEEEEDDYDEDDDDFSVVDDDDDVEIFCARLLFFKPTDGSLTRSMRLPRGNWFVHNAFELPNKTVVYSVAKSDSDVIQIGVPSEDGESLSVIRTLNLEPFESIEDKQWLPSYFTVSDDGLFFTDTGGRIIWFDSKLTDYQIISSNDLQLDNPGFIEYIKDKQQLLVYGNS